MALKKPVTVKKIDSSEAPQINDNFDRLYQVKLESRLRRDPATSAIQTYLSQQVEYGEANFSATGSPTIVKSFSLGDVHSTFIYANANALSSMVTAHVIDITKTAITIEARTISGTGNFSAVVTATVRVVWQVVGSSP